MKNRDKSQVSSNCAQNLVSGVMLCLAQIPIHFNIKPEVPADRFVIQMRHLQKLVGYLTCSSRSLDNAAMQLATATHDLVETGAFNLTLSLSGDFAETLVRERYIDPYVTLRFFRKCLRGPNGHHIQALYGSDSFLQSAAKYVLQRVSIQRRNILSSAHEITSDLLTIESDIFVVADRNSLWMKLDRIEGKIDKLRNNSPKVKAPYAKYTIGIKTAASIVGTSESTFRRRLEESDELRELMRQPNVIVCQRAVSRWWSRFVTGSKVEHHEIRNMNRPALGFVKS